ncbi:5-formyltetrahydrofolate cyclo-ligase [Ethanoligenens sp.]|uniref:5-formyltetrahydrofolate cyclo-ligase n=1 Tax=Ethanoligenens sp. TaxID=2099655 RepID=UPI0039E9AF3A
MDAADRTKKQALRESLQTRRMALTQARREQMDAAIRQQVISLPEYRSCDTLFSYVSVREEVDTHALIRTALRDGKRVAVPRCEGKRMVFYAIGSLDELRPARFGLLEPPGGVRVLPDVHSLCLVPGLSFDQSGARIGYGGGFYDRFLPDFPGVSVGLCYSMLISDTLLPTEAHDCRMSVVVSDCEIWKTNSI